jgi:very-short-patch-repair endonuclease
MLPYHPGLKPPARVLRRTMTDAERLLWSRVRGKQIGPVPFCRQKPLGGYLVDFHAPNSFVPERKVMFRQNPNIETRNKFKYQMTK